MKLASIDFDGEKKNPESVALQNKTIDFIAPAAFYQQLPKSPKKEPEHKQTESSTPISENNNAARHQITEDNQAIPAIEVKSESTADAIAKPTEEIATDIPEAGSKKINISAANKRVSGLSISSLKAKKEHELNKIEVVIDEDNLPKSAFTQEELRKHWSEFVAGIDDNGQKILASNLNTDLPKLKKDFTIHIELPNGTMKKEIEREQYELMEHLRSKLNNHFIQLEITVNEESAKKFAFTPEEKYEKLREKNPVIDLLRKEFDLDL
jgi:DNA polymerase-3 subunit gamma/tau